MEKKIELRLSRKLFNDVYYPHLFDYENRYEVYYGGAGSGKSFFLAQKLIAKACASKRKVLVVRKYATTLKDSVFSLICETLEKWHLKQMCQINLSTYTIVLPNHSCFLFKGIDDGAERIKSITDITDIWVEEGTELAENEYTQLDLRLRALKPHLQLFISFNPISKANWVYKKWFAKDVFIPEGTMILKTTYKDNKFLPSSYIKALEEKIHTDPTYYRIYALGEFASLEKLVYNNWDIREFNNAEIKGDLICGLDFGFVNDISAFVAAIHDKDNKRIYVFKEWGDTNKTNDELAAIISSLGFSKSTIIADAAEPKSIEELRRKGISRIRACAKGKDSILHGIQRLQQYEIIVHPSCIGIAAEFDNYCWQKDRKTNEYINTPIDNFNHYLDALRYSLQSLDVKKLQTINKSTLSI